MLSLIAVIGKNRELGKDNKLLWHIPGDLPRFKKITWGHPVIMGRKTHSTFQYKGGPLPGRTNIVITHDPTFAPQGFIIAHSFEESLSTAKSSVGNEEVFVIGGGSVYAQAINTADRLYLTLVDASADADTFFPDYSRFTKIIRKEPQEQEGIRFTYLTLDASK
jgi:dihydrofolate reductase